MKLITSTALLAATAKAGIISSWTPDGSAAMTNILINSCNGDEMCLNFVNQLAVWEDEHPIEVDDDGNVVEEGDERALGEDPVGDGLRRLKQLKVLILWLQPEYRFARYCFYGCYCLPDADHRLNSAGYGKPVDNVDASCKRQSECYECAQMDNDRATCDPSTTSYKYELIFDEDDPTNHMKKSIKCLDERTGRHDGNNRKGCKRSICECDKKLAEDLRTYFDDWDIKNHAIQGGFDWEGTCEHNGNGGHEKACCGNLGQGIRMPYRIEGRRQCCGNVTFDSTFNECCDDDVVKTTGTC